MVVWWFEPWLLRACYVTITKPHSASLCPTTSKCCMQFLLQWHLLDVSNSVVTGQTELIIIAKLEWQHIYDSATSTKPFIKVVLIQLETTPYHLLQWQVRITFIERKSYTLYLLTNVPYVVRFVRLMGTSAIAVVKALLVVIGACIVYQRCSDNPWQLMAV